jgi:hypothetical protein
LIEIVQRVVVLRRGLPIFFPGKMVEDLEPLTVDGVEIAFEAFPFLCGSGFLPKPILAGKGTSLFVNPPVGCTAFTQKPKGNR